VETFQRSFPQDPGKFCTLFNIRDARTQFKLTAETLVKSERGEDIHHAKDADDLFEQLGI